MSCKEELEQGLVISGHEEACKTFFTVKETPVRGRKVLFNHEAIENHRNRYAGFYVILTNDIKDPLQALMVYRNKDAVEKCFDDLKNQLDMKRLRTHSSPAMDGRLFVQFIALILMSALRRRKCGRRNSRKNTRHGNCSWKWKPLPRYASPASTVICSQK